MRLTRLSLVAVGALLGLAGCGGGGQPPASQSEPPPPPPPAAEQAAPAEAAPAVTAPAEAAAEAPAAAAPAETAAAAPAETAAPAGGVAALMAAADLKKGKSTFMQCMACHSLKPESEPGKMGPTLHGVIGRAAGSVPGFKYSDAVANSGKTWTVEEIDHWLEKPSQYLPGNKMVFMGLKNPQDRANVLAYIQQETAK